MAELEDEFLGKVHERIRAVLSGAKDTLVRLPDGRIFRCDCGATVFKTSGNGTYYCNGCGAAWLSEPMGGGDRG